jgi:hypothetical protein
MAAELWGSAKDNVEGLRVVHDEIPLQFAPSGMDRRTSSDRLFRLVSIFKLQQKLPCGRISPAKCGECNVLLSIMMR